MNKKRQRTEIGGDNGFEEWGGYMAAKKNKLQEQFLEQAQKLGQGSSTSSDIFKDVSVFVNGYTVPSADDIKRIMMVHGGVYHHYLSTEHTTHIIASNLPDVKIKQLKSLHVNIVKPEWITACLDANRQVDFRPFLLYSHQSRTQPSIRSYAEAVSSAPSPDGDEKFKDSASDDTNGQNPEEGESSEDLFATPEEEETPKSPLVVPNISKKPPDCKAESSKMNDPARCASDPNFLSEFYRNSRLHHISTMGAMFKQLVSEFRQKKKNFPGVENLKEWKRKNPNVQHILGDDDGFSSPLDDNFSKTASYNQGCTTGKIIMHIDMDCFFVSVGLRRYPHLRGKPVAVTHSKGKGSTARSGSDRQYEFNFYKERLEAKIKTKSTSDKERIMEARTSRLDGIEDTDSLAEIASCSYEAREKGVKNGMFVGAALKLCPDLEFIPYDFEEYDKVAKTLYNTVADYTVDIEAVSCDEMLVDCTEVLLKANCSPLEFATFLRKEIRDKTQCPASTGFGSNRLLARLATRKAKPDGVFYLEPTTVVEFMTSVGIKDLPGVGRTMAGQLQAMGAFTCGDLQKLTKAELCEEMGNKTGELLYGLCRGLDSRPLNYEHQRKSVSAEVNYGIRFKTEQETDVFIRQLAVEVQTRLLEAKVKGCCITLKLLVRAKNAPTETAKFMGHGVCDALTRSSKLSRAVCDADTIAGEVLQMIKKLNVNPSDLRGVGIQISQLVNLNSVSSGALDKFIVKNSNHEAFEPGPNPPSKPTETSTSVKQSSGFLKTVTKKNKIFPNGGTMGIDQYLAVRKKTSRLDNVAKLPAPSDLDLEVLEALPEDIRNEVLQAYSSNANTDSEQATTRKDSGSKALQPISPVPRIDMEVSYSQVDPTFLEALPSDMRKELEADFRQRKIQKQQENTVGKILKNAISAQPHAVNTEPPFCLMSQSILRNLGLKANEIKDMIRQWILQETKPQPCDVHMLEHYFCDLVHEKSIDDLHVILKFFRRFVVGHSTNSIWREKFHDILSTVQASMQEVYHSSLQVEDVNVTDSP